jgi:hypothetical protein
MGDDSVIPPEVAVRVAVVEHTDDTAAAPAR